MNGLWIKECKACFTSKAGFALRNYNLMLTSLVITVEATETRPVPAYLGRANQQLFLSLIDPALAQALHDEDGLKPFTVSNLMMGKPDKPGHRVVENGEAGWLRFTGLTEPVSEALLSTAKQMPDIIEINHIPFRVTGVTFNPMEHPWANVVSYQEFAASYLLTPDRHSSQVNLHFAAPTTFRRDGRYVPLPIPDLIFGSLLDRWQSFAPIALHPEMRRFAKEVVTINRHKIHTHAMPKKSGQIIGFIGQVTFSVLHSDRYWLSMTHLLANFAFYSGVGYQTTSGLGQVRMGE
jgi:CRISPR-associated endoribonuclease Cas6